VGSSIAAKESATCRADVVLSARHEYPESGIGLKSGPCLGVIREEREHSGKVVLQNMKPTPGTEPALDAREVAFCSWKKLDAKRLQSTSSSRPSHTSTSSAGIPGTPAAMSASAADSSASGSSAPLRPGQPWLTWEQSAHSISSSSAQLLSGSRRYTGHGRDRGGCGAVGGGRTRGRPGCFWRWGGAFVQVSPPNPSGGLGVPVGGVNCFEAARRRGESPKSLLACPLPDVHG